MTLGQRLQELRKQKGLSQEGLGEKLGVSRQAVSRWEMDGAVPEVDKLVAMAKLFGVSLDQLLTGEETETVPAAGKGRRRRPSLMAVLCILLSLALAVSLSFNFYYRYQVLMILDPPQPPEAPVQQVEYAFQADYGTMTYDLALSLVENGELKGYDVQLRVSTYLSDPLGHQLEEVPVTFRDGEAQVQMEGLHFDYHKLVGVSLVYTKGELEGQQNLLLLEPTGRGISWLVEDGSPEGWAPLSIEENRELLAAP